MYKVTLQNLSQYYFSLQSHKGKRLSLSLREIKVFKNLSNEEANYYLRYIPLGLSVIIEEFEANPTVIEPIIIEPVIEEPIMEEPVKHTRDELEELKKADLRVIAEGLGLSISKKTKAELVDMLVNYYGIE
jgi:hypothetical protein